MPETLELFSEGCLGTCWYGKYHYMEPWAGCGHDCPYCYARFRGQITSACAGLGTSFEKPAPLFPETELLRRVTYTANSGKIDTLKLCRFTDFFTPEFVENGLAFKILWILAASKVRRIIITTKGVPDAKILELIASKPEKFSYNAAVRPPRRGKDPLAAFERGLKPLDARLDAAAAAAKAGALTTIHLDPFVAGFDDDEAVMRPFLAKLKERGLKRVMFSYLLLNDAMAEELSRAVPRADFSRLKESYEPGETRQYLPGQADTVYWSLKGPVKKASVEKTASLLEETGFDFVLCSLKSTPGLDRTRFRRNRLCDGKFYA